MTATDHVANSNGKMYYGILGDANGDSPQVTGEASWLMARTCFPNDDLNGNKGHTAADVTCKYRAPDGGRWVYTVSDDPRRRYPVHRQELGPAKQRTE